MRHAGPFISRYGLDTYGIRNIASANWNLTVPALYEESIRRQECMLSRGGALVVRTGEHTGRAPNDKFITEEASSKADIWWGAVNRPIAETQFEGVYRKLMAYYQGRDLFVQDCYAGAAPSYRLPIRVITDSAWHSLFARNMFLQPPPDALADLPATPSW